MSVRTTTADKATVEKNRSEPGRASVRQAPATALKGVTLPQRTVGNQVLLSLLRSGALRPKLTVGAPDDAYEQEADRVADTVMRMPEPALQTKPG